MAIDRTSAARFGLYDLAERNWNEELLGAFSTIAPWVRPEALPVPIAAGAHDQAAAFLGAGGSAGGNSVIRFGSSDCISVGSANRPPSSVAEWAATIGYSGRVTEPYYLDLGDGRFRSTIHAQGAWNPHEQHMAPASGLLTHVIDREFTRDGLRIARLSFDIHGIIHGGEFEVRTRVVRPGRTIELVQAELICGDRTAITARAWLLATADTSDVAATEDVAMPPVESAHDWDGMSPWPGGFIESVEFRVVDGSRPGSRRTWLRSQHPLVDSGRVSPLAHLVRLIDSTNGLSARVSPEEWLFPNVDLQVHLYRLPEGEWLGLDGQQHFGPDGVGLTTTVLNDARGPFGRAEQILTLRRR